MRSTRSPVLARRSARRPLTPLSLIAVAFAASCGSEGDTPAPGPAPDREMHEVTGTVQAWPGETQAPCGARLTVQRFDDAVGARAATETRTLITTAQAYRDYFGHAAPPSVSLGREWVIFYAAGRQPTGGHSPDVSVVGVRGDVLHVVTTLTGPLPPCVPPPVPPPSTGFGGTTGGGSAGAGAGAGGAGGSVVGGNGCASTGAGVAVPTNNAGPAMPATDVTPPGAPLVAPPPQTVPVPPPAPVPPPGREYLAYVLVKIPAQATRSVEFQHQDITPRCGGDPQPNPCHAVRCAPGQTCVVLESFPPQARCVPITPTPPGCLSSSQCPAGLVCSTELGICGSNPTCGPNSACDAACWGTCMKKPEPEPRCTSSATCPRGTRCSTERGDCQGCGAGPGVACPAVCFGVCEPAPSEVCTGAAMMGACRSEDSLKLEAVEACRSAGMVLRDFGVGGACVGGGFAAAKYTCCGSGPTPPPPPVCKADSDCRLSTSECGQSPCTCSAQPVAPPPPDGPACAAAIACLVNPCASQQAACVAGQCVVRPQAPVACTWSYMGGSGGCRTYDSWKQAASEACRASGGTLNNISTGGTCMGGFTEVKYECCPLPKR